MKLVLLQFTVMEKKTCVITITPIRTKFIAFFPDSKSKTTSQFKNKHKKLPSCHFVNFVILCTLYTSGVPLLLKWKRTLFLSAFRQLEYNCTQFMKWKWCGNEICMWQCNCKKEKKIRAGEEKNVVNIIHWIMSYGTFYSVQCGMIVMLCSALKPC